MTSPALCLHSWASRSSTPTDAHYTCSLCGCTGLRARGTTTIRALVRVEAPPETVFNTGARTGDVVRRETVTFGTFAGRGSSTRG